MADPGSALDTGSKPFACRICGRQFSRPDSVTRHQKPHSQTEQQQRTQQDQDQQQHQPQDGWPLSPSMSDYTSIQSVMEQNQSITYNPVSDMNEHMFTDPALSNSELDIHLEWPDSEALLQSIVTFDWGSLTLPPGNILTPQAYQEAAGPQPNIISVAQPVGGKENQDPNQLSPVNGSRDAIQSLSDMVTCLSQNVTSAAKSLPELNPAFLDSCLQAYFSHFNIYFPILHRPTFVYRDCSPSLILNAMALGSLFIGTEDAAKGWTALLRHRGPYDSHRGVQLVLTALLGQCYAVMSEKTDLKLTSQVFHSLGFSWAHQNKTCRPRSSEQQPGEISDEYAWKQWAADEVYHRALVGHYILDGQLSYLSGKPDAATLHAANTLRLSASSEAFEARDPQEWRRIMDDEQSEDPTFSFSDIYHELFATANPDDEISPCLRSVKASLDVRVVLECLHALVLENREAQPPKSIVKIPALLDVKHALVRVFHLLNDTWSFDENERLELMIRRQMRLLHAAAIQDSVNQLPFNRTNTFWMPMPIFAASGMYSLSRLSGMASVSVPASIHWESTLVDQSNVGEAMQQDISWKKTQAFISSNMKTTNYGIGPARNLPFEMKKMQTLMRGLASQWGVAVEMLSKVYRFMVDQ
ncbi:C2H2 type zinc finger domain-containing protein [Fusarium pseudoanthophilum]|uniref:C2H2 type zinc finger domain-containing protein n=1 Tax=Fusarium pseudoanthophilum TaxID=48495 RepID=A0A8H5KA09_9HYPO|nr:C2H2 type zinc finger domain-containing protein [Fusarium pseudoanthophilum]